MRSLMRRRTMMVGVAALAASALAIGGGVAVAGSDDTSDEGLTALAERLRAKDAFATDVADKLGTTAAKLTTAITEAAADRIDAAEKSGGITATNATALREALVSDAHLALRITQGAEVAKKLGVTEEKLDAAYSDVRKAQALARIDQAVKDDLLTEKVAEQMRTRIEAADFPGFGARIGGRGFGGHGHGFGGPGLGGRGPGMGGEGRSSGVPGTGDSGAAPAAAYGSLLY